MVGDFCQNKSIISSLHTGYNSFGTGLPSFQLSVLFPYAIDLSASLHWSRELESLMPSCCGGSDVGELVRFEMQHLYVQRSGTAGQMTAGLDREA